METTLSFRAASLDETLARLQENVRRSPADTEARRALFQLLCVVGNWTRAGTQLTALRELSAEWAPYALGFSAVLAGERLRAEVFQGRRTPLVLGEPPPWMGHAVRALGHVANGEWSSAAELRARAWEDAPEIAGEVDGHTRFSWLADADSRLGPVLEAFVDGKYFWVPFAHLARVELQPPTEVLDLVWARARITWQSGGESDGLIPVRYPGTEAEPDEALRGARATHWRELPAGTCVGLGQRILISDHGEHALLDLRCIDFAPPTGAPNHG